ncbi:hypothetical protein M513_08792 [Trichuris suis]|uniref:PPIase cyclophilin-type domain-containing protein n=1 Tax=Trichuris suis TaxID=68888 RepID=A0A085LZ96_9BILA|nr:hypothetical protein M513_08792 [Trichuris suis]
MVAAGFTSTVMEPITKQQPAIIDEDTLKYSRVKSKGYVRLVTNKGPLNFELHCELAPRACENFIVHCKTGYYTNTLFHRVIRNFVVQAGDPTGTGKGGESIWKKPFADEITKQLSHSGRGILSMANRGSNTNTSQLYELFIFIACQLDGKHTIFGRLVGGMETLSAIERVPTDDDRPLENIVILSSVVFVDPFEKACEQLREERQAALELQRTEAVTGNSDTSSKLPEIVKPVTFRTGVGKYIEMKPVKKRTQASEEDEDVQSGHVILKGEMAVSVGCGDQSKQLRIRITKQSVVNIMGRDWIETFGDKESLRPILTRDQFINCIRGGSQEQGIFDRFKALFKHELGYCTKINANLQLKGVVPQMRAENARISGPVTQEVARRFALEFQLTGFQASSGRLEKFMLRHKISQKILCAESNEVPVEVLEDFIAKFRYFASGFKEESIFNADECALLFKAMPDRSLALKEVDGYDILVHCHHLEMLHAVFLKGLSDILSMKIPDRVVDPFCNLEEQTELQEDLVELQNNEELKLKFRSGYRQFLLQRQIASSVMGCCGKASYRSSIVIIS